MAGRQAKILHEQQINDLLIFASATRNPLRNKLIVLLSVKAGLRAGEIAGMTWDMVLDPIGEVSQAIELHDCIAKKNSGRRIPVNPALRTALTAWCLLTGDAGRVIRSERGDAMSPICMRTRSAIPRTVSAQPASCWRRRTTATTAVFRENGLDGRSIPQRTPERPKKLLRIQSEILADLHPGGPARR
jgi:integrase